MRLLPSHPSGLMEPWVADAVHRAVGGTLVNMCALSDRAGFVEVAAADEPADAA
jgi:hypothetical protein